ncbi:hypothetical protein PGB90_001160 [Kerria lacca]
MRYPTSRNFFFPKTDVKMRFALDLNISVSASISLTVIRRSSSNKIAMMVTFVLSVVTVDRRPDL